MSSNKRLAPNRRVFLSQTESSNLEENARHGDNRITTSKYNVATFLPLNLFI